MKSCPQCERTFEDTFSFCLVDGSVLSAPFDPDSQHAGSKPGSKDPQATELLPATPSLPAETKASPAPTIPANFQPAHPVTHSADRETFSAAEVPRKTNSVVWLLGSIALLLVIVILFMTLRSDSPTPPAN